MRSRPHTSNATILLVDDDEDDVATIEAVLTRHYEDVELGVATTEGEAIAQLSTTDAKRAGNPPDLVLVDPSLPGLDGVAFLERLTSDPDLPRVPVIVLSRSVDDEAALACYQRYANAVIKKPEDDDRFVDIVGSLGQFWLSIAQLPHGVA